MTEKKVEQVLVFPAPRLEPYLGYFEKGSGIVTDPATIEDVLDSVLAPDAMRFMDRPAAEQDERFKQVIPYCVLTHREPPFEGFETPFDYAINPAPPRPGKASVYVYSRTKKGGEKRLYDRVSLGVGGHINPCDGLPTSGLAGAYGSTFPLLYDAALRRELLEEVSLEVGPDLGMEAPVVALVYDPSDAVGRVHFGVVHQVAVKDWTKVVSTDPAMETGVWVDGKGLDAFGDRFENWSKLVLSAVRLPC